MRCSLPWGLRSLCGKPLHVVQLCSCQEWQSEKLHCHRAFLLTCCSALQVSFRRRSSLRRRLFSLLSIASSPCVASLTTALFTICCARCANASVDWLSRRHAAAGLTLAMITVLALPPKESCSMMPNSHTQGRWSDTVAELVVDPLLKHWPLTMMDGGRQ